MVELGRNLGLWVATAWFCQMLLFVGVPAASGQGRPARDALLSLVRPVEVYSTQDKEPSLIDRILSLPLRSTGEKTGSLPPVLTDLTPGRDNGSVTFPAVQSRANSRWFHSRSPGRAFEVEKTRVASLQPVVPASSRRAATLLDSSEDLTATGSLVADPRGLYSSFEIEVDRSRYTIKLYGLREEEKKLLFSEKVGLGSAEFPTPRGSYYIMKIFDDKPIWIPPDSWWAWGQSPSRSVYGGHMMPLFIKRPVKGSAAVDHGPDMVAPRMAMVDSGGYRVHGTDTPWSVGSAQSHGCVRMLNRTVKELADKLKMYVGTTTRGQSPNGPYINLARPVKMILY